MVFEKKVSRLKNAYNDDDDDNEEDSVTASMLSAQSTEIMMTEEYLQRRKKRVCLTKGIMISIIVFNLIFDCVLLYICITCTSKECMEEVNKGKFKNLGFKTRGQWMLAISSWIFFIYLIPIIGWVPLLYYMTKLFKQVDREHYYIARRKAVISTLVVEIFAIFRLIVYYEIKFDVVLFKN